MGKPMSKDAPCTMGVGCDEAGICYASAHGEPGRCPRASPPVSTDGLVERLRTMGCYGHKPYPTHFINPDGPEAADRIEQLTATLADRDATIERLREATGAIHNSAFIGVTNDSQEAKQVALESVHDISIAALDASATDHD